MGEVLAILGLGAGCAAWVLLQRWVTRHDPEAPGVEGSCGRCPRPCDSGPGTGTSPGRRRASRLRGVVPVLWVLSFLLALVPFPSRGASAPAGEAGGGPRGTGSGFRLLPPRLAAGAWVFLPKGSYTSETGFALGADAIRSFRGGRRGDLRLRGEISFRGQLEGEIVPTFRWGGGNWIAKSKLKYSDLALRFYGIGRDTPDENEKIYRPGQLFAYVEGMREVLPDLRIGVRAEYEKYDLRETEADGLLSRGSLRDSAGEQALGAGFVLDWDTRPNPHAPDRGWHLQASGLFFDDEIGSRQDFNNYHVDLRRYSPLGGGVVAGQLSLYSARGNAPFWRLAALGGRAHSRGYRKARYLDRALLSGQVEYRSPPWRRTGLVVFAGIADVAPSERELRLRDVKPTMGIGLRYVVHPRTGRKARLDTALGRGSIRVYLHLDEAF